jgi:pimeloyl-ACP methyl ester carboxylesterase
LRLLLRLLLGTVLLVALLAALAWCLLTPERVADALLQPGRRAVSARSAHPKDHGLLCEDFTVTTDDGVRLAGWFLPAEKPTPRTVLILHGVGSDRTGGVGLATSLRRTTPMNCVLFDFRGHGLSEGTWFTYGARERRDVAAVTAWLRDRLEGSPRLSLVAWSAGAAIALVVAAGDAVIEHVVAVNPFADLREMAWRRRPFFLSEGLYQRALAAAEQRAGFALSDVSPIAAITGIRARVLLIAGEADREIPAGDSRRLHAAARGKAVLWTLPGIGHDDWWQHPQFTERVAGFLRE